MNLQFIDEHRRRYEQKYHEVRHCVDEARRAHALELERSRRAHANDIQQMSMVESKRRYELTATMEMKYKQPLEFSKQLLGRILTVVGDDPTIASEIKEIKAFLGKK